MVLFALPPIVPAFEMSIATQGMSKGILQAEEAQFVPRALIKASGFQLGGQWKNLSTNNAKGEASLFAGWTGKAGAVDLGVSVAHKVLTSASGSGNRRSWEFGANAGRKFGRFGLRASALYSPDDFGATRSSLYLEGGPSIDLPWKLRASATIGLRARRGNRDYTSFNAGLSRTLSKNFTVDVRYYDTDSGEFGEAFDNRIVGSIRFAI